MAESGLIQCSPRLDLTAVRSTEKQVWIEHEGIEEDEKPRKLVQLPVLILRL